MQAIQTRLLGFEPSQPLATGRRFVAAKPQQTRGSNKLGRGLTQGWSIFCFTDSSSVFFQAWRAKRIFVFSLSTGSGWRPQNLLMFCFLSKSIYSFSHNIAVRDECQNNRANPLPHLDGYIYNIFL